MTKARIIFPLWAVAAWALTVALVAQLLGGDFETRSCQTDCVWTLYWVVFSVTLAGCVAGGWWLANGSRTTAIYEAAVSASLYEFFSIRWWLVGRGEGRPPVVIVSVAALALLLLVFLTMMAIGVFA